MVSRRLGLLAAGSTALLACLLGAADAQGACPTLTTRVTLPKTVIGGRAANLRIKLTNTGAAAINDAGLGLTLPGAVTCKTVKVSPKPATAPAFQQQGSQLVWTGLGVNAKKALTLRIKLQVGRSAGDHNVAPKRTHGFGYKASSLWNTTIGVATWRGPINNPSCLATQSVKVRGEERISAIDACL